MIHKLLDMGANWDKKNRDGKRPSDLTGHWELEQAKSKVLMCYLSVLINLMLCSSVLLLRRRKGA